ncbi:4-hydroxythreonine-4-phosphate dehydrogenase 1 [bacterium BMS3Abin03]|nr:4-hydroxythreonine-4-phosphate dehydrogenase 1 [bacterium BMS3Abin03]
MNNFCFTCGDINGIGPEIVIKALNKITLKESTDKFYFVCPSKIFLETSLNTRLKFDFEIINKPGKDFSSKVAVLSLKNYPHKLGAPTISSGKAAYDSLDASFKLWQNKKVDAIITAPISKTAIKMAGYDFPGQTEMFADWTNSNNYAMMFLSSKINAGLATIHLPLKKVASLLKIKNLHKTFEIIYNTLKNDLAYADPKIGVLGLNPHAGEGGLIGDEEKKIIIPAIKSFSRKIKIEGPFPPDAFWGNKVYENYDAVIGMYHDQVLIPFKLLNFGKGVNFTAGLPVVRTSPDHGVAYDIAGKNIADESSIVQAFNYALRIVKNRKRKIGKE